MMTLWFDESEDALELLRLLRSKGYTVETILTAGRTPCLREGSLCWCFGYQNIYFRYHLS